MLHKRDEYVLDVIEHAPALWTVFLVYENDLTRRGPLGTYDDDRILDRESGLGSKETALVVGEILANRHRAAMKQWQRLAERTGIGWDPDMPVGWIIDDLEMLLRRFSEHMLGRRFVGYDQEALDIQSIDLCTCRQSADHCTDFHDHDCLYAKAMYGLWLGVMEDWFGDRIHEDDRPSVKVVRDAA